MTFFNHCIHDCDHNTIETLELNLKQKKTETEN